MSNPYLDTICNNCGHSGSANLVDQLVNHISGGQVTSSKQLVRDVKKHTKVQGKRIDKITELSETNMALLEEDLKLLDTTLRIYNVAGIFAASTGILGTVLLGMKLKDKYKKH
jgi:hypothetical protein